MPGAQLRALQAGPARDAMNCFSRCFSSIEAESKSKSNTSPCSWRPSLREQLSPLLPARRRQLPVLLPRPPPLPVWTATRIINMAASTHCSKIDGRFVSQHWPAHLCCCCRRVCAFAGAHGAARHEINLSGSIMDFNCMEGCTCSRVGSLVSWLIQVTSGCTWSGAPRRR